VSVALPVGIFLNLQLTKHLLIPGEAPKRRTTLLYEHADTSNDKTDREDMVMELLKELVLKTHLGVERDVPSVFSHLVAVLTSMNYNELEKVFSYATDKQMR
jgi:hypothetical protein